MSWIAVGTVAADAISGAMSSQAASSAAGAQKGAADQAATTLAVANANNQANLQPFLATGSLANNRLALLLGLGGTPGGSTNTSDWNNPIWANYVARGGFTGGQVPGTAATDNPADQAERRNIYAQAAMGIDSNNPLYGSLTRSFTADDLAKDVPYNTSLQFGLDEGTKSINRLAAANGGLDSGAALKALTRYATDYAGTKATDAYNRFTGQQQQLYSMMSGTAGSGQQAANNMASLGMSAANGQANYLTQGGNATAAGIVGGANAYSSALNGVGNNLLLAQLTGGGQRAANTNNYGGPGMDGYATGMSDMNRQLYGTS